MEDATQEYELMSLRQDMKSVGEYLKDVSEQIIENKISNYPVFIVHKEEAIQLGRPLIIAEQTKTNWSFNASFIENLIKKGILDYEKLPDFQNIYKNPKEFACIFMATPQFMNFVWCPFNVDEA